MMSERKVTKLAIRWHILAMKEEQQKTDNAQILFSKANTFIYILNLSPSSKKALKDYAEKLLNTWTHNQKGENTSILNKWLDDNINPDFEHQT